MDTGIKLTQIYKYSDYAADILQSFQLFPMEKTLD